MLDSFKLVLTTSSNRSHLIQAATFNTYVRDIDHAHVLYDLRTASCLTKNLCSLDVDN